MISKNFTIFLAFVAAVAAQTSTTVICIAGQCVEGYTNTTIGATLSASSLGTDILLLPGEYTSTTNPSLLSEALTSSSASLVQSAGFGNSSSSSSISLPLTIALEPGFSLYPDALYSGQGSFLSLPTTSAGNTSTPLLGSSLALSSNIWVAVSSANSNRVILWNSIPDVSQLPSTASGSLSLLEMQSTACSPPCSGAGICSSSGTCLCPTGFTGSQCESCASNFFGPDCQPCPSDCDSCDDGISGSGICLIPAVNNPPSSCNCINGECGSNGECTCNPGWTTASNGTACAECANGFFLDSNGNCEICQLGCLECASGTGDCITCASGFTQDANDATLCDALPQTTSGGTTCPDGSFSNGTACELCSPTCQTCNGATSNDCIICASGSYVLNGSCVTTNSDGVCEGSTLVGNNNKHECDTCGAQCTSCQIPNFSVASTINEAQCTGCLPGFVLSNGACVESCPSGTFLSPQDNLTCTACDSSCTSCAGSATFCLTCANNLLASSGQCVTSCPSNTFSSSNTCTTCHPDCATCSGSSFSQCTSCNSDLPVLSSGRCLPTCSSDQFFDTTSSSCQSCDSSCSSCSASGPSNCLACSSSSQVLQGGTCVSASCTNGTSVVSALGVCLSDLAVTQASGTAAPLPSITGLTTDTTTTSTSSSLQWWEILLMALGCAFIFLIFLLWWRRRARRQRAKATAAFASAKALDRKQSWRWRLMRFGERLFGHGHHPRETEEIKLMKLRAAEEARHNTEMEKLGGEYFASFGYTKPPSPVPPPAFDRKKGDYYHIDTNRLSAGSLYSQVTGQPRRIPEPRQPVRGGNPLMSRFSSTTLGSDYNSRQAPRQVTPPPLPQTDAEAYAASIRQSPEPRGSYWLTPTNTGNSRNPFRQY